jgi:hypothetical protein
MKIRKDQIKKIKTLQSKLKMPDEEYRTLIMSINEDGFASSCLDLTEVEADALIEVLDKKDNRDGYATNKQQVMVRSMFRQVSWYKDDPKAFKHAFRNFLHRIAHVDDLRFLARKDVQKVVRALKAMKTNKEVKA